MVTVIYLSSSFAQNLRPEVPGPAAAAVASAVLALSRRRNVGATPGILQVPASRLRLPGSTCRLREGRVISRAAGCEEDRADSSVLALLKRHPSRGRLALLLRYETHIALTWGRLDLWALLVAGNPRPGACGRRGRCHGAARTG